MAPRSMNIKSYHNSARNLSTYAQKMNNSSLPQTNRSYYKLGNESGLSKRSIPFSQYSHFTSFTGKLDNESYTPSGTFYSPLTLRNKKLQSLTSRSGFWSNFNAIYSVTKSHLPTQSQVEEMDKISQSQLKNCKNLKEELKGAIYSAEKYNDV